MTSLSLTQDMKLQQKLSPQQIQLVRLLELPSCELSQRVNEELQDNPALEEGCTMQNAQCTMDGNENDNDNENENENFDDEYNDNENDNDNDNDNLNDNLNDNYDFDDDDRYVSGNDSREYADPMERSASAGMSFGEYLKSQIYLTKMDKPHRHIAKFVVGNIDEDGYLRRQVEELCDDLYFREGLQVSDDEMKDIIAQIQQFDPSGVGARDLNECLRIQLSQKAETDAIRLAKRILDKCFEEFSRRRFDKIQERLGVEADALHEAVVEITKLNPKPGSAWQGTIYDRHQTTVIPDFYVENHDGQLSLSLNTGEIPTLHVSRDYRDMLETYQLAEKQGNKQQKEALRFVKQKLDAAQAFIDAIKQRNETLTRTMTAIMQVQHEWFMEGDETYLKPLVLQDIANRTGYDVSTISRVSNSKYVQTEFGVFPLKYFFSEKMVNADGEEVSTREIKKILSECVAGEDKQNPLTDDALVALLGEKGYPLARRTVAKYRDQLGIPVARLRRQL